MSAVDRMQKTVSWTTQWYKDTLMSPHETGFLAIADEPFEI
jgi:hypothetical protein